MQFLYVSIVNPTWRVAAVAGVVASSKPGQEVASASGMNYFSHFRGSP
jgi:hypothetical protein